MATQAVPVHSDCIVPDSHRILYSPPRGGTSAIQFYIFSDIADYSIPRRIVNEESAASLLPFVLFTSEKATGQQEISLTLHLDHEDEPELTITLYRCDGSKCLAVVDGKSVAYVPRGEMVTLAEAVRTIALS